MNANDIKTGSRVAIRWCFGERNRPGTVLAAKTEKYYGEWKHRVILDFKPKDNSRHFGYEKNYLQKIDGEERYIIETTSRDISFRIDDNNQPILSAAQKRRRKVVFDQEVRAKMIIDLACEFNGKLNALAIGSTVQRVFGKTGQNLCIPIEDLAELYELIEDRLDQKIRDLLDMKGT